MRDRAAQARKRLRAFISASVLMCATLLLAGAMGAPGEAFAYSTAASELQGGKIEATVAPGAIRYGDGAVAVSEGTYRIHSSLRSNLVIDVAGGSSANGANVQVYSNNDTTAQKFTVKSRGSGWYSIANAASGKVLDVAGGVKKQGTNVQMYQWNGSAAQLWRFYPKGGGFVIKSKLGYVLDVAGGGTSNGTNVQIWSANSTASQTFSLASVVNASSVSLNSSTAVLGGLGKTIRLNASVAPSNANSGTALSWSTSNASVATVSGGLVTAKGPGVANITVRTSNGKIAVCRVTVAARVMAVVEGYYRIQSALGSGKVVDIKNGARSNGTNVQLYSGNGTIAQTFRVTSAGGGWYRISSYASNNSKVLDIAGGSAKDGTNVQLYAWNGSAAQLFQFIDAGNGRVSIRSKLGTVLDVAGGSSANGANIQSYTPNATAAQQFTLVGTSVVPLSAISINSGAFTLSSQGATKQLSVNYAPSNATGRGSIIDWSTSNGGVARVSSSGVVTAVGNGTATITATAYNGVKASVTVRVAYSDARSAKVNSVANEWSNRYWTKDGKPSDSRGTTSKYYYGIQCKGFASWVFSQVTGVAYIGKTASVYRIAYSSSKTACIGTTANVTSSTAKDLLSRAKAGDFIQMKRRKSGGPHSAIVKSVSQVGVTVLDCNADNHCKVQVTTFSWAAWASKNSAFSIYRAK